MFLYFNLLHDPVGARCAAFRDAQQKGVNHQFPGETHILQKSCHLSDFLRNGINKQRGVEHKFLVKGVLRDAKMCGQQIVQLLMQLG